MSPRLVLSVSLTASLLAMAGCSPAPMTVSTTAATVPAAPAAVLSGHVRGGQQPVANATIQLYTVGTTGDGSLATAMLTQPVTTDDGGGFSITGLYTCAGATEIYLTATGGNPGGTADNPNLALMTAFGPCGDPAANASLFIQIDEVTTVAAVAAVAPYMSAPNAIGSTPRHAADLAAAFTLAAAFSDFATGTSPGAAVPANTTVPVAEINTLANILAACVNTAGGIAGDPSACGQLFALTTPPNNDAPADTVSAMLNVADNPALNTPALFSLAPASPPFQPQLTLAPADFHVALTPLAGAPNLQVSPASLTFPATTLGFTAPPQTLTLTNTGALPVRLSGLTLTGPASYEYTDTTTCPETLAPTAACIATIHFTPGSLFPQDAALVIASNAPTSPQAIPLNGAGALASAGPVTLSASTLSYTIAGTTEDVNLSNTGTTPLAIRRISSSNANFAVTNTCGVSLPAGAACTISVQSNGIFFNGSTFQTYSGVLTVDDDDANGPQTVALTSTNAEYVQPTLNFAPQTLNVSTTAAVTILSGSSTQASLLHGGTVSGLNPADFSVAPAYPLTCQTLPCTLNVTFSPTQVGPRAATLHFDGTPAYIPLAGTGK